MKEKRSFSISKRLKSFKYAFNGFLILVREEHNSRIHLTAAILSITLASYFSISSLEWIALLLTIGFVISMEILNSAIENIADFISPQKHDMIKKIKDLSAAAVLTSAITAISVGVIIFAPKLFDLLKNAFSH